MLEIAASDSVEVFANRLGRSAEWWNGSELSAEERRRYDNWGATYLLPRSR